MKSYTFASEIDTNKSMHKFLFTLSLLVATITLQAQPEVTHQQGSLKIVTEPGIERLHKAYIAENRSSPGITGYRVQIYNGRKAETLKMRSDFLSVFPSMEPYTLYDSPEYKLQVGDFRTRLEAEKFLKQVIEEFGSGFVVKTQIKPPRLEYAIPDDKR